MYLTALTSTAETSKRIRKIYDRKMKPEARFSHIYPIFHIHKNVPSLREPVQLKETVNSPSVTEHRTHRARNWTQRCSTKIAHILTTCFLKLNLKIISPLKVSRLIRCAITFPCVLYAPSISLDWIIVIFWV
ncbi:hypothetical protein L798_11316 [Zootermopsis nevadensis]|uniref:Uncharacterized protein n=1 Tax=Zootermopsis nevadensis TaxID=136037 RepID=A0A067QWP1_ZOONE|nr:hypothetical protein L798_11316 [Zootermopsis nevadensis]